MKRPKILWGVCGIGLGHARRQLPVIQHYAGSSEIALFTYGSGLPFFRKHFRGQTHIKVHEVCVPYWPGNPDGLDFAQAARVSRRTHLDLSLNARAMEQAHKQIGVPDLVVSDYEPVSAQYAYAMNAPLMTLDQQSKYIEADFPPKLAGTSFVDEVMRLGMFFPKADRRLACSFFAVTQSGRRPHSVSIIPPILDEAISRMRRQPDPAPLIVVYLSEQCKDPRQVDALVALLADHPTIRFAVYLPKETHRPAACGHLRFYQHGSAAFLKHLAMCHGIISTAGHSLLSEAMHLEIPVLALPLKLYEQQMNAHIIAQGGFGLSALHLTAKILREFLGNLPAYHQQIKQDRHLLLRGEGLQVVCREINHILS